MQLETLEGLGKLSCNCKSVRGLGCAECGGTCGGKGSTMSGLYRVNTGVSGLGCAQCNGKCNGRCNSVRMRGSSANENVNVAPPIIINFGTQEVASRNSETSSRRDVVASPGSYREVQTGAAPVGTRQPARERAAPVGAGVQVVHAQPAEEMNKPAQAGGPQRGRRPRQPAWNARQVIIVHPRTSGWR